MCEIQPNKPLAYNEAVIDFGLDLIARPESWTLAYSPLDVLKPIFQTEGHITESHNFSLTFKPHFVNATAISPLRDKVLNAVIDLLFNPDVRVAVLAADALHDAFRYPMGLFNSAVPSKTRDGWTSRFVAGLQALEAALTAKPVDDLVLLSAWSAVSWHVHYGKDKASDAARRIKALLPDTLEFRTLTVLIDGHGIELRRIDRVSRKEMGRAHR